MIDYEWLFLLLSLLTFDDNKLPSSQKKDRLNTLDVEDLSDDEDETWSCTQQREDSELDSDDNGQDASKGSGKSKKHCHSTWETNHQVSDSEE